MYGNPIIGTPQPKKEKVSPWSNLLRRMLKGFLQDLRGMFIVAQLAACQQDIAQLSSLRFAAEVEDLLPLLQAGG